MNGIGTRIQQQRRRLGFTQEQLAERLGVTNKTVSKWECGVTAPDIAVIVPLAQSLQMSTDELLGMLPLETDKEKYDNACARYRDGADPAEGYWHAREAVAAYPQDFRYTLWLADTECRLAFREICTPDGDAEYLDECTQNALRRYEEVIEACREPDLMRHAVLGKIRMLRFCERTEEADWCAEFEYPEPDIRTAQQALHLTGEGRRLLELLAAEE